MRSHRSKHFPVGARLTQAIHTMKVDSLSMDGEPGDVTQPPMDDGTFDSELSLRLVALLKCDTPQELVTEAVKQEGVSSDDLLSWRLNYSYEETPSNSSMGQRWLLCRLLGRCAEDRQGTELECGFNRLHHLAVYYRARRTLEYMAERHGCQLSVVDDADGSNLLHTLAKARILQERQGQQETLDQWDNFEAETFRLLAGIRTSHEECRSNLDQEHKKDGRQTSLLQLLCLKENNDGLRPLEYAMQVGAYTTFKRILDTDGYLKMEECTRGIRVHRKYNLGEYDLTTGTRRHKNPILVLSYIRTHQVTALLRSGLMKDNAIVDKWIDWVCSDLYYTFLLLHLLYWLAFFQLTPLSVNFHLIVTMAQHAYELDKGLYEYADWVKQAYLPSGTEGNASSVTGNATLVAAVQAACKPHKLVEYLCNGTRGAEDLKMSPIYFYSVDRGSVIGSISINHYSMASFLTGQFAILAAVAVRQFGRSRVYNADKRGGEYLVKSNFQLVAMTAMFVCGIQHVTGSYLLMQSVDCSEVVLGLSTTYANSWMAEMTESAAVMYMFFAMLCLTSGYEVNVKRLAFLSICFRKMFSRFMAAVPLFLIWAYFVFGTLLFIVDFNKAEFRTAFSVFYSPLRVFLNTANISSPRVSTAILHTLFVLLVSINIQNFLIAYVSNEYNEIAANFDLVHRLTRFDHLTTTWQMWGGCLRHWRRLRGQLKPQEHIVESVCIDS